MLLLSQNRMIYFLEMILNDTLQSKTKELHARWSFGTKITVLPRAPTVFNKILNSEVLFSFSLV